MTNDANFLQRLAVIESELLALDRSSFQSFHDKWNTLVNDLDTAMGSNFLQDSTITTAHFLANRVSYVVQTFLDIELLAERLMVSLLDETSSALDVALPTPPSRPLDLAIPPYVKPSYDWLVENTQNPYPSPDVRESIALKSRSARKDVDNWFIDARKRIGWNAARKAHFSNRRVDIVDAATRFHANDEKLSLSQDAELALISIMKNAQNLYSDKFNESVLAAELATVVKDLTPQTKADAKAERMRQLQMQKDRDAYPSPDRSPGRTRLSPLPSDDEVDNTTTQPISTTNRKRRSSSVEAFDSSFCSESRIAKRSRLNAPSTPSPAGLPSPASSIDEPLQPPSPPTLQPPSSPTLQPLPSLTLQVPPSVTVLGRKRRLSESDGQGAPKRPRNIPASPRLQAVSDPMSLSSNLLFDDSFFDGWFQQTFDIPEGGEISPSGFSVELGNLSDFDCDTPAETRSATPEYTEQGPEQAEQTFQPTTIEAVDLAPTDALWGDFDFGLAGNLLLPSDSTPHLSSMFTVAEHALPAPLAQDLANFESFYNLSDPTFVIPLDLGSKTWDFEGPHDFGKHNGDLSVRTDFLSPYDFSNGADILPSPDPIYFPAVSQDRVRREKEKEFREAFEKAQKLAFELRGEGVVSLAHLTPLTSI
ncbi:hypothetical protein C0991_001272 [Blastosporella zonata]|nr:hypothetical protein C0991_001272 [Blastosporella zonata]